MTAYVPGINETDLKQLILSLQQLAAGRSNAVGTVTLATGSATTTVSPTQTGMIAAGSTVILTPMTAAAAAELASGNMFVSAVANNSFTITHTNSATTGRTFRYAILG
jgi:hypothetical protein